MRNKPFGHAAVLGTGMAGLVAARVLSDFFDTVTLFERDDVPGSPDYRRGVPQGRQFHALIPGGLQILSELLPGITADLEAGGSLQPGPGEFYFYMPQGKSYAMGEFVPEPPPDTGERLVYVQTRPLLEHCVRARVEAIGNIETRYRTKVEGVVSMRDGQVTGVTVAGSQAPVEADLIIDALGTAGKTLRWLDQLGFERPAEDVVNCDFAYTSVMMKPRRPDLFTDVGFFVFPDPDAEVMRGGGLIRMEGGLWLASVGGRYGDYPPRDFEGFMEYVRSTPQPIFHDLVGRADPVGEPHHFRFPKGVRRHFEQLSRFPEGLLPIGDSICHYNPLYGQGMSAACRQAMALQRTLHRAADGGDGLEGLWRSFLPEAYQEIRAPWLFATLADFSNPKCTGDFPSEESGTLAVLQYVMGLARDGDAEAQGVARAIGGLTTRLDVLETPPWPERFAASQAK